jgi:hypothetical protein
MGGVIALAALASVIFATARPSGREPASGGGPQDGERTLTDREHVRRARLETLRHQRDRALANADTHGEAAGEELDRIRSVKGESLAPAGRLLRYGSDGTGDPRNWQQSGPHATKVPNHDPSIVSHALAAIATGRLTIAGAATTAEIRTGLIDPRILRVLLDVSSRHTITVNSLRVSHPEDVQDRYGNPVRSNHSYGRSADISTVDGHACKTETSGQPYRSVNDNPPPRRPGPCMRLANELTRYTSELQIGEAIFYWRAPGPGGVSLKNHDDHVHIGYRHFPTPDGHGPLPAQNGRSDPGPANQETTDDLQVPSGGKSHTIAADPSGGDPE